MGSWGYYSWPMGPRSRSEQEEIFAEQAADAERMQWYEELMACEDYAVEEVKSDEGGWGAWMGGEL